MVDYWKLWKRYGDDWRAIYNGLKPWLSSYADRHHMKVAPWRWDEPSVTCSWQKNRYNRSLKILFKEPPYGLSISGSAWRDVLVGEKKRIREYTELVALGELQITPADVANNVEEFATLLDGAKKQIDGISKCEARIELDE
jgi:hypothetical protein